MYCRRCKKDIFEEQQYHVDITRVDSNRGGKLHSTGFILCNDCWLDWNKLFGGISFLGGELIL